MDQGWVGPEIVMCRIWRMDQGWVAGVDSGFSEGGGANDSKGEWGVPPPTQSREAFAVIVCD